MTYLYAGLGIAMLLPIMAGLQLAIAMGELEASNDSLVHAKYLSADALKRQEADYLEDENSRLSAALATPLQGDDVSFGCSYPMPRAVNDAGFALDTMTYPSACALTSETPYSFVNGVERKARLYVELSASGVASIVDSCIVSSRLERCAREQEKQAS